MIRLHSQVNAQVLGQVGRVGEGLGAVRALVWLCFRVGLGVYLHVRLGEERQWTHFTSARRNANNLYFFQKHRVRIIGYAVSKICKWYESNLDDIYHRLEPNKTMKTHL